MDLLRRRRPPSVTDVELTAAITTALARLRAVGNPGLTVIPGPRLRTPRIGWSLDPRPSEGTPDRPELHLLPCGTVLVAGRAVPVGRLDPVTRQVLTHRLPQLGRYVLTTNRQPAPDRYWWHGHGAAGPAPAGD